VPRTTVSVLGHTLLFISTNVAGLALGVHVPDAELLLAVELPPQAATNASVLAIAAPPTHILTMRMPISPKSLWRLDRRDGDW
jgi:hypothetical protein